MITGINNTFTFTGKNIFSKMPLKDIKEFEVVYPTDNFSRVPISTYHAYSVMPESINLERHAWGYKAPNSKGLEKYKGATNKEFGLSTEVGGYGGAWLKAAGDVPLSTKDVRTCAVLHLYNENTNEQMLYHVWSQDAKRTTPRYAIKKLITKEFPEFTHVNILPGDQYQTSTAVNNIDSVVDELNPNAIKQYYHITVENPEVIGINGKLEYLENKEPNKMTFKEIKNQYNY